MAQENCVYPIQITGYTAEGNGVGRADGQVVFVPGALAGETADVRIVHVGKRSAWGEIVRVTEPSPHRIEPDCPYFGRCGGCALRHMDYEEELRMKSQKVLDALTRLGGAELAEVPILGAETVDGYRNKAIFPVGTAEGRPAAGFFRAGSHELIPVGRCRLQPEAADLAKDAVVSWMRRFGVPAYDEKTHTGLVRDVYVRIAPGTGQALVCPVIFGKTLPHEEELLTALRQSVPGLETVVVCENPTEGNVVLAGEFHTVLGGGAVFDTLCGLRYRLSPRSFYQVNRDQAQRLYELALSRVDLKKTDTALDLYCGTGTITLLLARRCGRAYGVTPDVVVVDPPRKGLSPDVIVAVARMAPRRVVYISCDPATLGRDVARFAAQGYALRSADAVDLFPRTPHVECVTLMSRVEK